MAVCSREEFRRQLGQTGFAIISCLRSTPLLQLENLQGRYTRAIPGKVGVVSLDDLLSHPLASTGAGRGKNGDRDTGWG